MFTVLSKTRNSNLYLIVALIVMAAMLLTFAIVQTVSAPRPTAVPAMDVSAAESDYYERHPELKAPGAAVVDLPDDFSLRHPDWINTVQNVGVPVTGALEASDYFQRHPELNVSAADLGVSTPSSNPQHGECFGFSLPELASCLSTSQESTP
jgi:hypothetical protein